MCLWVCVCVYCGVSVSSPDLCFLVLVFFLNPLWTVVLWFLLVPVHCVYCVLLCIACVLDTWDRKVPIQPTLPYFPQVFFFTPLHTDAGTSINEYMKPEVTMASVGKRLNTELWKACPPPPQGYF